MCHLILLMPILAIPLFWFMPLSTAIVVYSLIFILSGWVYILAIQAMRCSVKTGSEEIIQSVGEVVEVKNHSVRVKVHSELWNAESPDNLHVGDFIEVISIKGLTLNVKQISNGNR